MTTAEATVRNRLEIGAQAIHRISSNPGHDPSLTEFHIDNTMRFVRAEIALKRSNPSQTYFNVKNAECRLEGVQWATSGTQHVGPDTVARSATWSSAVVLAPSLVSVATVEVFIPEAGTWVGRLTAVGDTNLRRASVGLWFGNYDPVAGFDVSFGALGVHDVFVMDYHVLQEV